MVALLLAEIWRHYDFKNGTRVDNIRFYYFNAEYLASFFSELRLLFSRLKIQNSAQVFNWDETGFSPDRETSTK